MTLSSDFFYVCSEKFVFIFYFCLISVFKRTTFIITQQPTNISNITGNLGNSNSIGEHFVATINDQQHIVLDASQLHTGLTPKPGQNFTFPGRMNGDYQTIAIQGQHGEIITARSIFNVKKGPKMAKNG